MSVDDHIGKELAEKLAKLNSSQQCIESLSRWCITYRTKAKQIVEIWDKSFKSAQREQRVSFLYLANDILQNSRRKGSEFVNEFWKFLPAALRRLCDNGDENGKKVACRLVEIWDERKVFGSRGQNLKYEILGKSNTPTSSNPPTASNGKSSNPIKMLKRDAQSLRIKLAVGGLPEKIITAFQLVLDENVDIESTANKCDVAFCRVKDVEKDVQDSSVSGNNQSSELMDKIEEEENNLRECVTQLHNSERIRIALVSQLKEALQEQESKLELIHNRMEIARVQIEQAEYLKQKLKSSALPAPMSFTSNPMMTMRPSDANFPIAQLTSSPLLTATQPPSAKLSEEESKKAAAAAMAAKLAASTSSAQMLTSVLSSLVAEEVASRSSGISIPGFSSILPYGSPEKRIKLDNPASFSNMNSSETLHASYFASSQQQPISNVPLDSSIGMQLISQGNQMQAPFPQPPPPPPPSVPPQNSPTNQLGQSAAMMMTGISYAYGTSNLPPPPLSSHIQMGYTRPAPLPTQQLSPQQIQAQQAQQPQQQQQQQPQTQLQPSLNGLYYRPPGVGFYGQSHQAATSPVPRQ